MQPLRIGLLGAGRIVRRVHAAALARLTDARVTVLAEADDARRPAALGLFVDGLVGAALGASAPPSCSRPTGRFRPRNRESTSWRRCPGTSART